MLCIQVLLCVQTRGECGEGGDIPGGETGSGAGLERAFGNCIIQESSEEACAPDSYNASANATLERDPSSMSQHSQLPPPMPELPPSSSFGLPHVSRNLTYIEVPQALLLYPYYF